MGPPTWARRIGLGSIHDDFSLGRNDAPLLQACGAALVRSRTRPSASERRLFAPSTVNEPTSGMKPRLEIQAASIVLRGEFSPGIFHPSWLADHNLIRQEEAEAADIELVHTKAAIFRAEWLQLRVLEDQFQASTTQEPYYEALRDLVVGILGLLKHTRLQAMGINREFHYPLGSEEAWHTVGHRLASKEVWEDIVSKPGTLSLTIQGLRQDKRDGYIRVKVQPSDRVKFGVYVEVNDHYELRSDREAPTRTPEAITILGENWSNAADRASKIATTVATLGEG